MCGIAGFYGTRPLPKDRTKKCLALMDHRGPDAAGKYYHETANGNHVHLLHTRLAIIDLDPRANQPFRVGNSVLTFNGEIYNYLEVKREMETRGYSFETQSDTEVLAKALHESGPSALDSCEGMWAFAQFDEDTGNLTLSRDRFGEKPLFIWRRSEGLYFGSEIKFIATLAGVWPNPNYDHLRRYLVNGYRSLHKKSDTFHQCVEKLPIATTLILDINLRENLLRYWTPILDAYEGDLSFSKSVALVRQAMIDSVGIRLRSDVPLAFCMSGGVDSNALIGIALRHFKHEVHGFTIMNSDERYEEAEMLNAALEGFGVSHTGVHVEYGDFLNKLRALVKHQDEPICTITYYAHALLMERMHDAGFKVSVSGSGADEIFSGYYDHHNAYLNSVKGNATQYSEAIKNWQREIQPWVRNPFTQDPEMLVRDPQFRGHIYLDSDEFASWLHDDFNEGFDEHDYTSELLRNRMHNELFNEVVPCVLHADDMNAMAYSIENRSPFLDRNLFETMQRVPTRHLVKNGRAKAVLREAVRGFVPDAVLNNPRKVGFNAPIKDFLDIQDPNVKAQLLDDSPIYSLVKKERIEKIFKRNVFTNSASKFLFNFINAKMFLEQRRENISI
jgi:asparagine synthase (glutamine-hydrolysing)